MIYLLMINTVLLYPSTEAEGRAMCAELALSGARTSLVHREGAEEAAVRRAEEAADEVRPPAHSKVCVCF